MPDTVETQIAVLVERLAGMDTLLEQKFGDLQRALQLQAFEYERRLSALNGESARIGEVQRASVTAEKFEDYAAAQRISQALALTAITDRATDMARRVEHLETIEHTNDRRTDRTTTWMIAGVGFFLTVVIIVVNFYTGTR